MVNKQTGMVVIQPRTSNSGYVLLTVVRTSKVDDPLDCGRATVFQQLQVITVLTSEPKCAFLRAPVLLIRQQHNVCSRGVRPGCPHLRVGPVPEENFAWLVAGVQEEYT